MNQTQLKWLQIWKNKNKTETTHDYSIFVNRVATLHDVFIMCNIFCSKHTWGRDVFMGGGGVVGVLPKANRNATGERFSTRHIERETKRSKWARGSFGKPTTGYLGTLQTTFRYTVYMYPRILYYRGVFTTFRSLVHWYCWETVQGWPWYTAIF